VPAGTKLTPGGYLTISTPGTIVEDMELAGITVRANNVTIRRCKIHREPSAGFGCIRMQNSITGLLVEDCELWYDAPTDGGSVVGGAGSFTLRRCNIHDITEGPRLTSGSTVEACYLHSAVRFPDGHIDMLQATAGSDITIRHNTILPYNPATDDPFNSAVILKTDNGPISNVVIEDNLFNGGNVTLYLVREHYPISNIRVSGNRWGRDYRYAPVSIVAVDDLDWRITNVWDDTNEPVLAG